MYTHILVPTDGSRLAMKAVKDAASLAKACKAKVTALYVIEPYMPNYGDESLVPSGLTRDQAFYRKISEATARKALAKAVKAFAAKKVSCKTQFAIDPRPWNGILEAARKGKCDLVVMASHGRGGIASVILGSEAHKVLAHSKVPVLVVR
jgi:nucleotide-binding universal stress UspA family protein